MKIVFLNLARINDFREDPRRRHAIESVRDAGHEAHELYTSDPSGRARAETLNAAAQNGVDVAWVVLGGTATIDVLPFVDWPKLKKAGITIAGTSDATHLSWMCSQHAIPFVYAFDLANARSYFPLDNGVNMIRKVVNVVRKPEEATRTVLSKAGVTGRAIIGGHVGITAFMSQVFKSDTSGACLFLEYHHPTETQDEALYWFQQIAYLIQIKMLNPEAILLGHNELEHVEDAEFREEVTRLFKKIEFRNIGYIDHYVTPIPFGQIVGRV